MKSKIYLLLLTLLFNSISFSQNKNSLKAQSIQQINNELSAKGNKVYQGNKQVVNNSPNIIYIILDDLGYGDLGNFWQNQITGYQKMVTPVLDKLANEGAMMTHHYTGAPVCAPARASLLEGLTQGHSSIRDNQFDQPTKVGLTLPEMLRKSGYRTMHVGKNGNAGKMRDDLENLEAHPLKRGFDQYYGYLFHKQGHTHYPSLLPEKNAYFADGYTAIKEGTKKTYTTDIFTAKSKQWIVNHRQASPDQPFFLYLAYDVPHNAYQAPTMEYPDGGGLIGGLQWTSKDDETPWVNTATGVIDSYIHPDYVNKEWELKEKKFATMIRRVDNSVADLIQLLKDLKIDKNTLIVFTSDNGPTVAGHKASYFQSYGNLNGVKRDLWEGGIKMPTICYYPGIIPKNVEVTYPSGHWDWLATFAELADVSIPIYTDGVSLMPSLKAGNAAQTNRDYLYHEYKVGGVTPNYDDFEVSIRGRKRGQMQVIRMGNYKGVRYNIQDHSTPFEIYDVVNDERESTDLFNAMPELHQQMLDKVLQVRKSKVNAPRPYDNEKIPSVYIDKTQLVNGLEKSIYKGGHNWVPNFEYLTPVSTSVSSGIDLDSNGLNSEFGISFTGYIEILTDGSYTFSLQSSSICHIMIHDIHLLDNDFEYTTSELSETLHLKAGLHPVRIYYQQNEDVTPAINFELQGLGLEKSPIKSTMFFVEHKKI